MDDWHFENDAAETVRSAMELKPGLGSSSLLSKGPKTA
jgi:hypothetical protein